METIEVALAKSAQIKEASPNSRDTSGTYLSYLRPPAGQARKILLKFADIPAAYRYRALYQAKVKAYFYSNPSGKQTIVRPNLTRNGLSDFDLSTVSWNSIPTGASDWVGLGYGFVFPSGATAAEVTTPRSYFSTDDPKLLAKRLATEVVWLNPYLDSAGSSDTIYCGVAYQSFPTVLELTFTDIVLTSKIVAQGKTSGYLDPHQANTFSWDYEESRAGYYCVGPWDQQSATFYWRSSSASTWNSVSAGTSKSVTIAAETFPTGEIEWYVSGTDTQGTTTQTSVYTLYTSAPLSTATAISPADTLVNSDAPTTFTWSVSNPNSPVQTGADIQYSADGGSTWTLVGSATGNARRLEVAAGSMPGGALQWRVRSYNSDGQPGPWSAPVSFYYIAAPGAPIVSATAVPFTTITWTATGQQAYEVIIDGVSTGIKFGTAKTYAVSEPLLDGGHSIQVRVQGIYGLWSQPGTVHITVQNPTPADLTLYSDEVIFVRPGDAYVTADPTVRAAENGETISFTATVSNASGTPTYQWQYANRNSSSWSSTSVSGNKTATISLQATDARLAYKYRCKVTADGQTLYSNAVYFVRPGAQYVDATPVVAEATASDTIEFAATIHGIPGYPVYQWQYANRGSSNWDGTSLPGNATPTVSVPATDARLAYKYRCRVTAKRGISLSAVFDVDALLGWQTNAPGPYLVYRDDVLIAKTNDQGFTDRFALGTHSYYVLSDLGDGYYSRSNIVTGAMFSEKMPIIAAADGGEWIELTLSENSISAQQFSRNRSHSLRHVTGAKYPICEVAQFEDLSGSYDVAFKNASAARAFEALFGKVVVIKSRGANLVVGVMTSLNKTHTDFYITYSFTIQQIEWEDYIDAANAGI